MCLIIHKPEGVGVSESLIRQSALDNPDGWGIMAAGKGRIRTWRGLSGADTVLAVLARLGQAPCAVHFRMATHGTVNVANCHPFEFGGGKYAAMHNGIFSAKVAPIVDKKRSDTWHFVRNFLAPTYGRSPQLFGTDEWRKALGAHVSSYNKLVVMRDDGAVDIVNRKAGLEWEGLWLSNDYSIPDRRRFSLHKLSAWDKAEETWADATARDGDRDQLTTSDLEWIAGMDDADLLELCLDDPHSIADAIRAHFGRAHSWKGGWK